MARLVFACAFTAIFWFYQNVLSTLNIQTVPNILLLCRRFGRKKPGRLHSEISALCSHLWMRAASILFWKCCMCTVLFCSCLEDVWNCDAIAQRSECRVHSPGLTSIVHWLLVNLRAYFAFQHVLFLLRAFNHGITLKLEGRYWCAGMLNSLKHTLNTNPSSG